VRRGHEIAVRAAGPRAAAALEALEKLAAEDFGDTEVDAPSEAPPVLPSGGAARRGEIRGLAASGGVAIGPARRFSIAEPEVPDDPASDPPEEWERLRAALDQARSGIESDRVATARVAGEHAARIFDAHLLFLSDEDLLESAREGVFEDGLNAARAWDRTVRRAAEEWRLLEDEYQRERAADILEVGARVLAHLAGAQPGPVLAEPGIVVGPEITAAQAAGLDPERALGIATSFGGPTAHSAILARSLGIPAVVGLGEALGHIAEGTPLLLDGDAGVLHVEPDGDLVAEHSARRASRRAEDERARESARQAAVTSDGRRIEVAANVAAPADVAGAVAAGADGIGLLRTEFLFMGRDRAPTEDDQYAALEDMATNLGGRPMIVRTLDAGADKPIDYLDTEHEDNPFLGERGIRLSLARPGLLATQLRAVLRVAADHPVKVMLPMVTTVDEVRAAKRILAEQRAALAADGLETPGDIEVGVMIEVPAAALMAHQLAPEVAFFSIGTNDLCQYTMAAERGNARVAGLADPYGPAVLRLIRTVVDAAEALGRWVGVCGELAGDRQATALLVGLGVTELSMSAPAIPRLKQKVREIDREVAGALAARAIELGSAEEVRALVLEDPAT
jgi:phosphoenolpyruvate-protein phosphotransferase